MYFLTEIKQTDFSGDAEAGPLNPRRWKVAARCEVADRATVGVLAWIAAMEGNDRRQALNGLLYLIKLAQAGEPLGSMLRQEAAARSARVSLRCFGQEGEGLALSQR